MASSCVVPRSTKDCHDGCHAERNEPEPPRNRLRERGDFERGDDRDEEGVGSAERSLREGQPVDGDGDGAGRARDPRQAARTVDTVDRRKEDDDEVVFVQKGETKGIIAQAIAEVSTSFAFRRKIAAASATKATNAISEPVTLASSGLVPKPKSVEVGVSCSTLKRSAAV